MALSQPGRKGYFLLILVVGIVCLNISYFYYQAYSRSNLPPIPVGWDTANYVSSIKMMQDGRYTEVLSKYDNVNFLYYFIASLIPSSPIKIETYLPIFLSISMVIAMGYFVSRLTRNIVVSIAVLLFASVWSGLFRIASDLHAQLFATTILFFALGIYLNNFDKMFFLKKVNGWNTLESPNSNTKDETNLIVNIRREKCKWNYFVPPIAIVIASFTHFETTLFLVIIFCLASMFLKSFRKFKKLIFQLLLPIIPALYFFAAHILNPIYFPKDLRIVNPPIPYETLFYYIGIFLPLIIIGGIMCFRLISSARSSGRYTDAEVFFAMFSLIWVALSLMVFRAGYFDNGLVSFSYRGAVFFPVPFLAASAFFILKEQKLSNLKLKIPISLAVIAAFVILGMSSAINSELELSNSSYLSNQGYSSLIRLSKTEFPTKPIFIYYPASYGLSTGGISEYVDNWVSAIYGDHFKYLGDASSLLKAKETKFEDVSSRYYSYTYSRELKNSGIWNPSEIIKHPIVVIQDYYKIQDLIGDPNFRHLGEGVYQLTGSNFESLFVTLDSAAVNTPHWYKTKREIDGREYILFETYERDATNSTLYLKLPVELNNCYSFKLRYQDASKGLGFRIFYGLTKIDEVHYSGSGELNEIAPKLCTGSITYPLIIEPLSVRNNNVDHYFISLVNSMHLNKAVSLKK